SDGTTASDNQVCSRGVSSAPPADRRREHRGRGSNVRAERVHPMERRIVGCEGPDGTRQCLFGLEAHGHPTESRAPDPAAAVLIMLDVHSWQPIMTSGLIFRCRVVF